MAAQYWVGDFFVDLTRNQITQKMQSQTIPPKALAVLTYLAKNANKVVSHDELLTQVWPDAVVTPNTLQRSIAQLRKALGQDSQYQSYIKTHAKQGYSLEVEVRWDDIPAAASLIEKNASLEADTVSSRGEDSSIDHSQLIEGSRLPVDDTREVANSHQKNSSHFMMGFIFAIAGIVILGFVGAKVLSPQQPFNLSFGELRSLTATDNKELAGIYSPDGQYIVFQRYSEKVCINSNLWAKDIKTQKETQLTKNMGSYSSHSFSKDGKELVFIESESCNKPITQKTCYKLMSLDFEKALKAPQSPNLLLQCKNSKIIRPTWLNNNNVALLQEFSSGWKLTSYSIVDNKSKVIYELEEGSVIDYDYSVKDDLIALTGTHSDGQNYIELIKPDGQVLSSHRIEYPPEISNLRFIYPNFTPTNEQLIFSTGRQLFTLSYQGKITNISLPLDEPMGSPIFHPDGKRMLMIKGHWDSDIATMPLSQISKSQLSPAQTVQTPTRVNNNDLTPVPSILERSIVGEDGAIFQPNGKLIAFKSKRSGEHQIWITDGNGAQQISHFPTDTYIYGMDWASDGQSILVNANNRLTQVYLDSKQESFPFDHRVEQLFQWDSEDNTALLIARIKGQLKFVEMNLSNSEFRVITDKKVNWALKSEDGRLIYTDDMDRFWQPGPIEDQLIESLVIQGSDKRFIIKNNVIYSDNDEYQLWSYDLNEATFEVLSNMPNNLDEITDINQTDILFTVRITAKKEVAELILAD